MVASRQEVPHSDALVKYATHHANEAPSYPTNRGSNPRGWRKHRPHAKSRSSVYELRAVGYSARRTGSHPGVQRPGKSSARTDAPRAEAGMRPAPLE